MRDILQDKPPKDVDMATDALPQQMVALCEAAGVKYILTGVYWRRVGCIGPQQGPKAETLGGGFKGKVLDPCWH